MTDKLVAANVWSARSDLTPWKRQPAPEEETTMNQWIKKPPVHILGGSAEEMNNRKSAKWHPQVTMDKPKSKT
ncbi:hypothetical protein COCMIDRAFT_976 [Bipolaris oryzae ATCC 44560]|uniref:Uncharacterized protein n=1 Tax=Bipolaris oryzae ATCC 44560 TaxID=930090 RepID=W6ZJN5_COCMI|nr:uncharacterized protein COCMIDRAFT_976 [Bipolaris oryzae ATCC 44560]EUC50250.1 hypothetical protein COCMIDRAFT_976 [Bipolaris oryzae ATCC 44560]